MKSLRLMLFGIAIMLLGVFCAPMFAEDLFFMIFGGITIIAGFIVCFVAFCTWHDNGKPKNKDEENKD